MEEKYNPMKSAEIATEHKDKQKLEEIGGTIFMIILFFVGLIIMASAGSVSDISNIIYLHLVCKYLHIFSLPSIINKNMQSGNYKRAAKYYFFTNSLMVDVERNNKEIRKIITTYMLKD